MATVAIPVVLLLQSVEGWPRLSGIGLETESSQLMCCVCLSLFDIVSGRFFGGTWSSSNVVLTVDCVFHQIAYLSTYIDDPACVAVVELVVCCVDAKSGACKAQYGCGWGLIRLFGDNADTRIDWQNDEDSSATTIDFFDGTPRRLVAAAGALELKRGIEPPAPRALAEAAGCGVITNCRLQYRLRRHDGLARVAHLIADDEFVSASELVPGLAPTSLSMPKLGGDTTDGPYLKPKLASTITLLLEDIRVKIKNRAKLEDVLLRYVGFRRSIVEANGNAKKKAVSAAKKRDKIIARRVAIGIHNGRALTLRRRPDSIDGWKRVDLTRLDGDVMAVADGVRIEVPGYVRHPLVALVVALEYEVRPEQPAAKTYETIRVTLGLQAYVPFDGTRLRLRTGREERYVELQLETSERDLSPTNFIFPPHDSGLPSSHSDFYNLEAKFGAGTLIGFELSARRKNGQECADQTPSRDSDQSSDEDDNLREEDDTNKADSSEPSIASSSFAFEAPPPRRPVPRRPVDDDSLVSSSSPHVEESDDDIRQEREVRRRQRPLFETAAEEAHRLWRSAAPNSSLLARTLCAPLHRDVGDTMPPRIEASMAQIARATSRPTELTRADQARLSRLGVRVYDAAPVSNRYDLRLELDDPLQRNEVTIQFAAVRGLMTRAVYFTYQFYTLPPTRTEVLKLTGTQGITMTNAPEAVPLVRDQGSGRAFAHDEPGLALKYIVDTTTSKPREADLFAEYLATRTLHVDVWDADSRMSLGSLAIQLGGLLRQRAPVAKCAAEYAIVPVQGSVEESDSLMAVESYVQVIMCNYGEKGDNSQKIGEEIKQGNEEDALDDWRRGNFQNRSFYPGTADEQLRSSYGRPGTAPDTRKKRPKHRVRAKALTESMDVKTLMPGRNRSRQATDSQNAMRVAKSSNVVTYDEVMCMVRRFRDNRGRVIYAGPLLALLEAPNLKVLEDKLVRVLTNAEARGIPLERIFGYLDVDHGGTVSAIELEDSLRALGCFRSTSTAAVTALLRKFDTDGDGVISLPEFVDFVRQRQQPSKSIKKPELPSKLKKPLLSRALEARIRTMLYRAEELGASVVDAFREFDADSSGGLTESEFIEALVNLTDKGVSAADARALFCHIDKDSSGIVELNEFLGFVGRDYTDHLVLKLRTLLAAVEKKGTRIADVFAAWDTDNSGLLSRSEVASGLTTLARPELSQADVIELLDRVDADKSGQLDVKELYGFVGWDYAEYVEARLRKILLVAARDFSVPLDAAFREWDDDSSGTISVAEFKRGLHSMRAWKLADEDVEALARRIDTDGSGQVSLKEFLAFVGCDYVAVLAERLRSVLLKAEAKGTTLDVVFAQWDTEESGKIPVGEFQKRLEALGGTFTAMADDIHTQPGITGTDLEALATMLSTHENEVRLTDLYAFMGRDPTAVLEAKLQRVVHSAGISAAEAFKHFDKNGDGEITLAELAAGLRELPGFEDVSDAEAQSLAKWYDVHAAGFISLAEFERQVGTQETANAECRLVASLRQAVNKPPAVGLAGLERALTKQAKVKTAAFEDVMEGACRELGVTDKSVSSQEIQLVLKRLASNCFEVMAFCKRRGVGTPAEISKWRDEPSAVPERTVLAREAESSGVLAKFGTLLTTFEDTTRQDLALAFTNLDKDSSGTVSASELCDGLRRLDGNIFADLTRADAERLVRAIDTDDSGFVDLAELRAFARQHRAAEVKSESRGCRRVSEIAESLQNIILKAETGGASTREIFDFFDINKNGVVSRHELGQQLEKFRGALDVVTRAELDALIAKEFDKNGDGQIDVNEFVAFVRRKPTASLSKQKKCADVEESSAATREKLRAILLRTEELGTPLRSAFRALDVNGDGRIETRELQRGLAKMGVFDEILDEGTIECLVRDCFDKNGDGMVDVEEFLAFAVGDEERGTTQTLHHAEDAEAEEDEDLQLVANDYQFSLDPDTRTVEKKLRRAARELATQGGDPRLLFHQYDPENTGSIIRSDFIQVLMQLGLSLLDSPVTEKGLESSDEPVRRRQMMQLARLRRHQGRPLYRNSNHENVSLMEDVAELAFVKWYREGCKRDMVRSLLAKSMVSSVDVYPTFGQTLWFEHELQNPLNRAERVAIIVEDNEVIISSMIKLRLIVSAQEWEYFRRRGQSPAQGSAGKGPVEADMIDASGPVPCVMLMANETVRLPFALLSLEPPGHDVRFAIKGKSNNADKQHPKSVTTVKFVSASGFVLAALRVNAYPRHCVVDQTLRFYQAEGEIIKRTIRVTAPPRSIHRQGHVASDFLESALAAPTVTAQQKPMLLQAAPYDEDDRMYVHSVTPPGAEIEVSLQWKAADGGGYEVLIRCSRTPAFPSVAEFYVLIFRDRFCAALTNVWHCVIHSRLRADANGLAGQAVGCSLVVRGDRTARVVKAYAGECTSSICKNASFDPPQAFRLVPNAHNKFAVAVRPEAPGTRRYHVHLVDCDTHELVAAWILTVVAATPQVTKTYNVDIQLNASASKRIPYRNPWTKPRRLRLVSSDQSLVRPRNPDDAVHLAPNGHDYLRLIFGPIRKPGLQVVYLYLNDVDTDQSEEVFLLRLLVANRNAL